MTSRPDPGVARRLSLVLLGAVPAALLSYLIGVGLDVHPIVPFVILGPVGVWLSHRLFDGP